MLDKQFPETLATIYVIRAPYIFPTLFALVRPFLSAAVQRRIQVLGSNYADVLNQVCVRACVCVCVCVCVLWRW